MEQPNSEQGVRAEWEIHEGRIIAFLNECEPGSPESKELINEFCNLLDKQREKEENENNTPDGIAAATLSHSLRLGAFYLKMGQYKNRGLDTLEEALSIAPSSGSFPSADLVIEGIEDLLELAYKFLT